MGKGVGNSRCFSNIYSYASTQQSCGTTCYAPLKRSARGAICASVLVSKLPDTDLLDYRYFAVRNNIAISLCEIISLFCNAKQYRAPKVHIAFTNGEHILLAEKCVGERGKG